MIELGINNLAGNGDGVGRWEGMAVFVPGTLPGETVKARIIKVKKSFAIGELEEVLYPAQARIDPECRDFETCGGCQLQHLDYESQLKHKRQNVKETLSRIGKVTDIPIHRVIGMENPWNYRNKVHFQLAGERGNILLGFFAPGSHRLVSAAGSCRLVNKSLNEVAGILQELINKHRVAPYHWGKRRGLLRNVMLRIGEAAGEIMVVFATVPGKWPEAEDLAKDLISLHPRIVSVVRNINTGPRKVVLGNKNRVLMGREYITDKLGGLTFRLSANSFYQVNLTQAQRLYDVAGDYVGLTGGETVVDAYSGTGTIALYLAGSAGRVIGLESVPEAVADARENAKSNGINNAEFRAGAVENLLPNLLQEGLSPDVVVLDPPRAGCEEKVLEAIVGMQIPRVVYVSCNPATLARDLGRLQMRGYGIREVQPVDMFPWTGHVECVALIERG